MAHRDKLNLILALEKFFRELALIVFMASFLPCIARTKICLARNSSGRPDGIQRMIRQEVRRMVVARRILWAVVAAVAIVGFMVAIPGKAMTSSAAASSTKNRDRMPSGNDEVVVEMPESTCDQGICGDIYPQDGKIDGKNVSQIAPAGVNSRGQVVGLCILDTPAKNYAFVREPDGNFWIFKTPSSTGQGEFTDINDSGSAVGFYENDSSKAKIGFLMNSQHQWVMDIKYPSNPCPQNSPYLHTQPNGINDAGEIIGNYRCTENAGDTADAVFKGNGFYRAANGTYYRVQYENAKRTVAGKISNNGIIVGYYVIDDDTWVPFAAKKDDVIKPIVP